MQSLNYKIYRYIMNYQYHLTKFIIIKSLKTKSTEEIALNLMRYLHNIWFIRYTPLG
jgi:hypothetical protein